MQACCCETCSHSPTTSREPVAELEEGPTATVTVGVPAGSAEARVQVKAVAVPATPVQAVLPTVTVVAAPVVT